MTPRPHLFATKAMRRIFASDVPTRLGRMGDALDKVVAHRPLLGCWHATSFPDEHDTAIARAALDALDRLTLHAKVRTP